MSFEVLEIILAFVVVISLIVFVHELGHYLAARWVGVQVETFSIGFGREIFGITDRHGTRFRVSLLPLGGYVKMLGDADAASARAVNQNEIPINLRSKSLPAQRLHHRALIAAAGPAFNLIFAVILLMGLYTVLGQQRIIPVIANILPNSPAAAAHLQTGDRILAIDNMPIDQVETILTKVTPYPGKSISLTLQRGDQIVTAPLVLSTAEVPDGAGGVRKIGRIGIGFAHEFVRINPATASFYAVKDVGIMSWQILVYLKELITGDRSPRDLGGLISIAELSGQAARLGIAEFSHLLVVLSINLGIINLLPIPVLDGGHLMLHGIEAVRGRPLSERMQNLITSIGFVAVVLLMVVANGNDLYAKLKSLSHLFN